MRIKGYRTIAANAAIAIAVVADWLLANGSLVERLFADPRHAALAIAVINAVNIGLRFITTTPVGGERSTGV